VPLFSPSFRPHDLPVLTSFQSSLNQRFKAAPFSLFLTATLVTPVFRSHLSAFRYSARGIGGREHFIARLYLAITRVLNRTAFFVIRSHYRILQGRTPFFAIPAPRTLPPDAIFLVFLCILSSCFLTAFLASFLASETLPPFFILPLSSAA